MNSSYEPDLGGRLAIAVVSCNRRQVLLRTLSRLTAMSGGAALWVVDNGSVDGSAEAVACQFPEVHLIRLPRNVGAAARNHAIAKAGTPFVACCDDDTCWAPGSLAAAVALLDAHPRLAAVNARVLVGPEEREDPVSRCMAESPLPEVPGLPGTAVAGLRAGACVLRQEPFLAAGGYEARFFSGGEDCLLAIDLMAAGWRLAYVPELVVHQHPSRLRDAAGRRWLALRNALWCAWLRRPLKSAWHLTVHALRLARGQPRLLAAASALAGLPWVLAERRVVPTEVETLLRLVERVGS